MHLNIERAVPAWSPRLTEIAHAAKRHWNYPESWIEAWRENLTLTPEFIHDHRVFGALQDHEILGFYALILAPDKAVLEHLWVDPTQIGKGVGKQLFHHCQQQAMRLDAPLMEIFSDPNAVGFYKSMGAHHSGDHATEVLGEPRILPIYTLSLSEE